jgi:hypothetical protein
VTAGRRNQAVDLAPWLSLDPGLMVGEVTQRVDVCARDLSFEDAGTTRDVPDRTAAKAVSRM